MQVERLSVRAIGGAYDTSKRDAMGWGEYVEVLLT
jgi:hypothetical protein